MTVEAMSTALSASSTNPSKPILLDSSDEDDFDLIPLSNNIISDDKHAQVGSRNFIYGYQYACPYIVTAHMGKNGPFSDDKIYDKEFITYLLQTIKERNSQGPEGLQDKSLLCNQLDIHSVKLMRNCLENRAKQFRYINNGVGYFHVFVRVFTKKQLMAGKNTEEEMVSWMSKIADAFRATKAKYPFRLDLGSVLGKDQAHVRALDTLLLDADVAEYAMMIYGNKKPTAGKWLLSKVDKLAMFFSVWNEGAARALLG